MAPKRIHISLVKRLIWQYNLYKVTTIPDHGKKLSKDYNF